MDNKDTILVNQIPLLIAQITEKIKNCETKTARSWSTVSDYISVANKKTEKVTSNKDLTSLIDGLLQKNPNSLELSELNSISEKLTIKYANSKADSLVNIKNIADVVQKTALSLELESIKEIEKKI